MRLFKTAATSFAALVGMQSFTFYHPLPYAPLTEASFIPTPSVPLKSSGPIITFNPASTCRVGSSERTEHFANSTLYLSRGVNTNTIPSLPDSFENITSILRRFENVFCTLGWIQSWPRLCAHMTLEEFSAGGAQPSIVWKPSLLTDPKVVCMAGMWPWKYRVAAEWSGSVRAADTATYFNMSSVEFNRTFIKKNYWEICEDCKNVFLSNCVSLSTCTHTLNTQRYWEKTKTRRDWN